MTLKRVWVVLATGLWLGLAAAGSIASPALCADDFARGCQLYNSKDYAQAEPLLAATVRKFPKFWPGHYYLAHTYLAQGKKSLAKAEYEAVATCSPPASSDITNSCQKVLTTLGGGVASSSASASTGGSAAPAGEGDGEEGKSPALSSADKEKAAQLTRLHKEMNDKVDALRSEQKQRLADGDANSNQRYRFPDGSIRSQMTPEQKEEVEREFQQKIQQVQEDYKHRMSYIH